MVAFCAILLFGLFLGPQYPTLFFFGILGLVVLVIGLYFRPNWKDTLNLVVRVIALCTIASLADAVPNNPFGWICIIALFATTGNAFYTIVFKGMSRHSK